MRLNTQVNLLLLSKKIRRTYLSVVFCLLSFVSIGQNLVSNGSFEGITSCNITSSGSIDTAISWSGIGTPDLFNGCSISASFNVPNNAQGNQFAFDGNGYIYNNLWRIGGY